MAAAPAPETGHLHVANLFAHQLQAVEQRGAADDGRAVLVVVEHRNVHALAQLALDVEAPGALMSSRLMPPSVGSRLAMISMSLSGSRLGQFDVEHIHTGKL